jgi:two-component system, LytTR family, sensor kinase
MKKQQQHIDKPKDKWLRIIGIPVTVFFSTAVQLYVGHFEFQLFELMASMFIQIFFGVAYWETQRWWLIWVRGQYPDLSQTRKRIGFTFLGFMGIMLLTYPFIIYFFDATDYPVKYDPTLADTFFMYVIGFIFILIFGGVYEAMYFFGKYGKADKEAEELRKINLQTQFDSLKNQVNPHFLFNSLNSLSSLIAENPRLAEDFVDEMASVYRYLLQTNDKTLTTLAEELRFIDSYFHLLKTRYGEGISLMIDVPNAFLSHQLPPLTLQILVENAVKHNVISTKKPLAITIDITDNASLRIRNNLQKKTAKVLSNHLGLTNITTKYALLSPQEVSISDENGYFTVILPLLLV